MKLAIIGSRSLSGFDKNIILRHIPAETTDIVSGGAIGVDALAEEIAQELGLNFRKIEPDYEQYGKNAPIERNKQIISAAVKVLAVWDFRSRGTAYTLAKCIEMRVPVRIVSPKKP